MEHWLNQTLSSQSLPVLLVIIGVLIFILGKSADLLVEESVVISIRWGMPRVLVGATIVSLGTTFPEAAVSVLAAIKGRPGLALGNAVGSIICDTGLILGLAALMSPLPLRRDIVNRQGWLQLGAGFLLVLSCLPYGSLGNTFSDGGNLPRFMGFVFLFCLVAYMWLSIRWARQGDGGEGFEPLEVSEGDNNTAAIAAKFLFAITLVILSGLATPIENMPRWLQMIDTVNPVRYIITALRNIFLQGADTAMIWPQIWPLLILAGVTLPSAAWLFVCRNRIARSTAWR